MTERTPIAERGLELLREGYGSGSHAHTVESPRSKTQMLDDYEPMKLSTFRVFAAMKGTILTDPILFVEQGLLTIFFFSCAIPVYSAFRMNFFENSKGQDLNVKEWLDRQEPKMRAFAGIMTFLAMLLLSFYTAISVERWWRMRTEGVGGIKAATVDLEWLLFQNVTKDEKILEAVQRYGRTSLRLIFLWRQNVKDVKEELVLRGLLEEDEANQLSQLSNGAKHEAIWAWQGAIVTMLYNEGKIKSEKMYNLLLQRCTEGRGAVQLIHTHLAVRVPMQYVHVLGLLVKLHNFVIAIIMGSLFGVALRRKELLICVQTFGRTCILPFLFNAILLINANLADPFSGDDTDFPGSKYQEALGKDCKGFIDATKNMPDWISDRSGKTV